MTLVPFTDFWGAPRKVFSELGFTGGRRFRILQLRRYRTLTDLVIDARDWLKQPWPAGNSTAAGSRRPKHPDLPKKPMTPYFRFYHEKREKYSRENPDLSMTELAKLISKKFQELSDKKKVGHIFLANPVGGYLRSQ